MPSHKSPSNAFCKREVFLKILWFQNLTKLLDKFVYKGTTLAKLCAREYKSADYNVHDLW